MTFQLDQSPGFYGFVFSYDGTCVAHGADDSFVGLSLKQVFERSHIEEGGAAALKGEELHRRFVAAAEAGGGWVSYTARNPDPSCKPEPGPDRHLTCTFTRAREPSQVSYTWRNSRTLPSYPPHQVSYTWRNSRQPIRYLVITPTR